MGIANLINKIEQMEFWCDLFLQLPVLCHQRIHVNAVFLSWQIVTLIRSLCDVLHNLLTSNTWFYRTHLMFKCHTNSMNEFHVSKKSPQMIHYMSMNRSRCCQFANRTVHTMRQQCDIERSEITFDAESTVLIPVSGRCIVFFH